MLLTDATRANVVVPHVIALTFTVSPVAPLETEPEIVEDLP
jgi:hypothetical protein